MFFLDPTSKRIERRARVRTHDLAFSHCVRVEILRSFGDQIAFIRP